VKKVIKIILIIITLIVVLCAIFGAVDYSRAKNGKKPIFIFHNENINSKNELVAIAYYGLGYKLIVCNKYCDANKVVFMPLYLGTYAWFIGPDYITNVKITKSEECDNKAKLYYTEESRNIYIYCLDQIEIEKENETMQLKDYLWTDPNVIDDIITRFTDNNTNSYDDGGTILYKGDEFNLLKCHTLAGNNDIYIGDKTMGYPNNFCGNE
jgi:hypothetical protein